MSEAAKDTALLIIDVQVAFFDEKDPVYRGAEVVVEIAKLISKARAACIPVVYVQHCESEGGVLETGSPGWEVHSDITPETSDLVVQKHTPDSFHETNLHSELSSRGIKRLLVTGFQSECCIDTTCRRAWSLGYDVTLVQDCHSTFDTPHLTAQQVVDHHSYCLQNFAKVIPAASLELS